MMAALIAETDQGTKAATIKKCNQMQRETPNKFKNMMKKYWYKVYENTVQAITDMEAVDTGALRQSIRIINTSVVGTGIGMGNYEIGRTDVEVTAAIVAGGGGVINPRHKREVDYAQAVHDGYFRSPTVKRIFKKMNKERKKGGQKKLTPTQFNDTGTFGGSGWVAGRPFIDEGMRKTEGYLEELIKQYMDDKTTTWVDDQPWVSFSLPLMMFQSKYG